MVLAQITPDMDYTGWENRLYRIEIHSPGNLGEATYKWSKNNASTAVPIIQNAEQGNSSVIVKDVRLFRIGDIVEIKDDLTELAERESKSESEIKPFGELRRIKDIDIDESKLSWDPTLSSDDINKLPFKGELLRKYIAEGEETTHPKIIKWDGADTTSKEKIDLEDGVKIQFSGSGMLPGDYWTFTARMNTREVERLDNEPPHGVMHHYYPLAEIEWNDEREIINIKDLRTRFEPLCRLAAADIAFDRTNVPPLSENVLNVQQAIEGIIVPENKMNGKFVWGKVNLPINNGSSEFTITEQDVEDRLVFVQGWVTMVKSNSPALITQTITQDGKPVTSGTFRFGSSTQYWVINVLPSAATLTIFSKLENNTLLEVDLKLSSGGITMNIKTTNTIDKPENKDIGYASTSVSNPSA